jgi:hypothetical protein
MTINIYPTQLFISTPLISSLKVYCLLTNNHKLNYTSNFFLFHESIQAANGLLLTVPIR